MSAQPAAGSKVCIICGTNVAKLPRVKDEHGRYMCEGMCEQAARERNRAAAQAVAPKPMSAPKPPAPKPVAPPPVVQEDDNMMANLLDNSPAVNVNACPGCRSAMPGGALVCMNCGYNARVGKAAKTKVVKMPKASQMPVKRSDRYASGSDGPPFWKTFFVCTLVLCGICVFLPLGGSAGLMVAFIVWCLAALAAWLGGTVAAFKNEQTIWGVCGVLMIVPIINGIAGIAFLIYNLLFNQDNVSRALYWSVIVAFFALAVGVSIATSTGQRLEMFGIPMNGTSP